MKIPLIVIAVVLGLVGCSQDGSDIAPGTTGDQPLIQIQETHLHGLWLTACEPAGAGGDIHLRGSRREGLLLQGTESYHIEISYLSADCSTGGWLTVNDWFNGSKINERSATAIEKWDRATAYHWQSATIEILLRENGVLSMIYVEYVKATDDGLVNLPAEQVMALPALQMERVGDGRSNLPL